MPNPIIFICLHYPNTQIQNTTLGEVFLQAFYDIAADSWINSKSGQTISEFEVVELVKIAFERATTVETAFQGVHSTGIYPFDRKNSKM